MAKSIAIMQEKGEGGELERWRTTKSPFKNDVRRKENTENERWFRAAERDLFIILNNPNYLKANKDLILEFIQFLNNKNSAPRTICKHLYFYRKIMDMLDKKVDLKDAKKEDIEPMIGRLKKLKIGDLTKAQIVVTLRMIFCHSVGGDEYVPPVVGKWIGKYITLNAKAKRNWDASDLLTTEEIKACKEATGNHLRNLAIWNLITDIPIRPKEVCRLVRSDLHLSEEYPYLHIRDSKAGVTRKAYLSDSISSLAYYVSHTKLEDDDPLFLHYSNFKPTGGKGKQGFQKGHGGTVEIDYAHKKAISYSALNKMLKETAKRAGVKKNVTAYLCRHGTISQLAQSPSISTVQLELQAGWKIGGYARNAGTYVHAQEERTAQAVARAKGNYTEKVKDTQPVSKNIECWRCHEMGSTDDKYCPRCGSARTKEIQEQHEEDTALIDKAVARWFSNNQKVKDLLGEEISKR